MNAFLRGMFAFSCLFGMFMLSGCQKEEEEPVGGDSGIVGAWNLVMIEEGDVSSTPEELGTTVVYTYNADGTYNAHFTLSFYGELYEQDENGTYTLEGNNLFLCWEENGEEQSSISEVRALTEKQLVVAEHYGNEGSTVESIRTYERI